MDREELFSRVKEIYQRKINQETERAKDYVFESEKYDGFLDEALGAVASRMDPIRTLEDLIKDCLGYEVTVDIDNEWIYSSMCDVLDKIDYEYISAVAIYGALLRS